MYRPHIHTPFARHPIPTGGFEEATVQFTSSGHESRFSGTSGFNCTQSQAYSTSADSLIGCQKQLSVRKRHHRPQREISTDEHSIHLSEMNTPGALVSPSCSTHMLPPHHLPDENQPRGHAGTWNENRLHGIGNPISNVSSWDVSEQRLGSQSIPDPNSAYSPKNSLSPWHGHYGQRSHNDCQDSAGNLASRRPRITPPELNGSPQAEQLLATESCTDDRPEALRSKFKEQFESNRSVASPGHDSAHNAGQVPVSPRRISIGWMSEGRRIGYGYTLIPADGTDDGRELRQDKHGSPDSDHSNREPPIGLVEEKSHDCAKDKPEWMGNDNKAPSKASDPRFDIAAALQKLNLPRWAGPSFSLKTNNVNDTASCGSASSPLLGILAKPKKNQEEVNNEANADNPWRFCSWVRPDQALSGQPVPPVSSVSSSQSMETQLLDKLARNKRKMAEIARDLEQRALAKLATSTEQFPVIQRTATRVLRLKGPGGRTRLGRISGRRGSKWIRTRRISIQSMNRTDRACDQLSRRGSSGSLEEWDSLYEECLEEHPIPE
ncbi:hypothetical protein P175DRAFT_0427445 [Aspergillus ochraceoroseus IBT 24754]|uniref:Uncharacterized protein n=1 Tax=Aspergillus ochraceoroseus IBT 24754 TaxID=1392256 RepID=A0A2T5M8S5_9EURO|nr:uncharacterized protein P175DRAFT_0427445 [Aspergillus ochraceoroseus IBT 24754]PTU24932.1 hypothetical protein P175DRAFT_0427445 [Aspergillus ochraceoroseus IBT 24754]